MQMYTCCATSHAKNEKQKPFHLYMLKCIFIPQGTEFLHSWQTNGQIYFLSCRRLNINRFLFYSYTREINVLSQIQFVYISFFFFLVLVLQTVQYSLTINLQHNWFFYFHIYNIIIFYTFAEKPFKLTTTHYFEKTKRVV